MMKLPFGIFTSIYDGNLNEVIGGMVFCYSMWLFGCWLEVDGRV